MMDVVTRRAIWSLVKIPLPAMPTVKLGRYLVVSVGSDAAALPGGEMFPYLPQGVELGMLTGPVGVASP
jgi:hypothetical protein